MNQEKIQKFEDEIKKLFVDNPDDNWNAFWYVHLKPVIEQSKELAKKYEGNMEVSWLSAILHDIAQLDNPEDHEVAGSKMAYDILIENSFDAEISERVKNVVLTHRVNEYVPENLEQKILASADAICHFTAPHYFWMSRVVRKKPFDELMKKFNSKIDRDFNDKIFFEDEKKMVEGQYEILKSWFEFKI